MACRKDKPVKWSAVAKSGDVDIITTQCEAYGLAEFGHEYEIEIPTSEMTSQPPSRVWDPYCSVPCPYTHITPERESWGGCVWNSVNILPSSRTSCYVKVCIVLFAYKSVLGTVFQYATVLLIEMLIILCVTIITGWSVHNYLYVSGDKLSACELISHCITI